MTVVFQVVIDQREITSNGTVQVRLAKQIVNDDVVMSTSWHRCSLAPGQNADDMTAAVDIDLTKQGYGPVVDWSSVKALVVLEHTPEVIKTYQDTQAATAKN